MSIGRKRIVSAALLLPVVLFSVAFTSFALWRCRFDGLARNACCCPGDAAARDDHPALVRADCCAVEHYVVGKAPAEAARTGAGELAAMVSHVAASAPVRVVAPPVLAVPWRLRSWRADDGWPGGLSVLARKQSLLI